MKVVYIVSIPWDSHSVKMSYAFKNKSEAKEFAKKINEKGYHGYVGGIFVEECEIYE